MSRDYHESPIEVTAELGEHLVRIEVIDAGGTSDPTVGDDPSGDEEHGRGLAILDLMAKEWGWERLPAPDGRMRVWFTVAF